MDILKSFVLNNSNYEINILWKDDKPLFRANEIAKVLEIKNISDSTKNFDNDEKLDLDFADPHGRVQKTKFLTEQGTYRLLMRSNKSIARPFQKWVCDLIVSIRETGKYELKKEVEKIKEESEEQINKIKEEAEQRIILLNQEAEKYKLRISNADNDALIESFNNKYVVYYGKIKDMDNDKSLIKIGSTKCIKSRITGLREEFGSMTLFKVLECETNERFEKFLHKHKDICKFSYREELESGKKSSEVFLMTEEETLKAVNIALHNIHIFRRENEHENKTELERLKIEHTKVKIEYTKNQIELEKIKKNDDNNSDNSSDTEIDNFAEENSSVITVEDTLCYTQAKGDKIQRYSADGKILLKTYSSAICALRDEKLDKPSRLCLINAANNNTIYKKYRWALLDREKNDNTFQELAETVKSKEVKKGFVAMLSMKKDKIEKVYIDQKEAMIDRDFKSSSAVSCAIKRGSLSRGNYFVMWFDCSDELKEDYLNREVLPQPRVTVTSKQVQKFHPVTKELIQTYSSVNDVIKEYQINRNTLAKAIELDIIKKGFYWKFVV